MQKKIHRKVWCAEAKCLFWLIQRNSTWCAGQHLFLCTSHIFLCESCDIASCRFALVWMWSLWSFEHFRLILLNSVSWSIHSSTLFFHCKSKWIYLKLLCKINNLFFPLWCCAVFSLSDVTSPTILLAQSLKVILGFQTLWPSILSHINFDLKKLLPGQQQINFPPIVEHLTLQILLQEPAGSLKWHQQVSAIQRVDNS